MQNIKRLDGLITQNLYARGHPHIQLQQNGKQTGQPQQTAQKTYDTLPVRSLRALCNGHIVSVSKATLLSAPYL